MGRRGLLGCVVLLGFAGPWAVAGVAPRPARTDEFPQLGVIVCDSAAVPAETLTTAEGHTSRVFQKAGIQIQWLECSKSHVADYKDEEQGIWCHRPRVPAQIVLEVLRHPVTAQTRLRETGGFAWIPRDGQSGDCAGVFYDRAQDLARTGDASAAQILGHVAAHEIGHILLGAQSHFHRGIMRPEWSRVELRGAALGALGFEPRQAESLRIGALARVAAGASSPDAASAR